MLYGKKVSRPSSQGLPLGLLLPPSLHTRTAPSPETPCQCRGVPGLCHGAVGELKALLRRAHESVVSVVQRAISGGRLLRESELHTTCLL